MRTAARLFIFVFLFSTFNFQLSTHVFAQVTHSTGSGSVNPYAIPQTNPDVPQNMHTWSQTVFIEVLAAASCQLSGVDPINPQQKCLGVDAKTGKIGFVENSGGAIGMVSKSLSVLFTPPIHTTDYFAYLGENFGITKKAYAANCDPAKVGAGFCGLTPLIKLWEAFRNIVYLVFIVVFVIVGLAIMLRLKIDPRTVMSIENQLPKLITGILFVTFSFAIAGLVVDMMYVSMYLVYNTVSSAASSSGLDPKQQEKLNSLNPGVLQGKFPLDAIGSIGGVADLAGNVAEAGKTIFQKSLGITPLQTPEDFLRIAIPLEFNTEKLFDLAKRGDVGGLIDIRNYLTLKPADTVIDLLSVIWSWATAPRIAQAFKAGIGLGPLEVKFDLGLPAMLFFWGSSYLEAQFVLRDLLPRAIVFLVIAIALLWAMFRLGFELLKAYIFFLLDVVLAPFWIVGGLFPGSPMGFGPWLRNIAANLSVFPVTIGMLMLGKVFMDVFTNKADKIFAPPLIGNPTGGTVSPLASLIGIGFILLTPQVLAMIKELVKAPSFKYAAAIGQAVGVGTAAVNIPEHAQKLGMLGYYGGYMRHIPWLGRFLGGKQDKPTP